MNAEKIKKIVDLVNANEILKAQLENSETVEDIVKILADNGVEISSEEILAGINTVDDGGELDEGALEQVAGGYCSKGRNWKCFWSFMSGYIDGIAKGLGLK